MSNNVHRYWPLLLILMAVCVLYSGFLYSPVVFDDIKFFDDGSVARITQHFNLAAPRQIPYWTMAISWVWFGNAILPLRVVSLLLHAATGISLYFFLRQVQQMAPLRTVAAKDTSVLLPLMGALVFVVHPVSVYGAAYLIERTIVMATLFALWSWWCALEALKTGQQRWVWCSVGAYALSAFSKEHAVMVPLVSIVLALWWWRTQRMVPSFFLIARRFGAAALVCVGIAIYLVLYQKGLLGTAYELDIQTMRTDVVPQPAWLLSVITQGWLFFKYLALWLLPNPLWMSADMREPFAATLHAWPQTVGLVLFVLWAAIGGLLVWRGGRRGLLGVAMLAPGLLFATELVTVRYHEIFVLYRSYLWLAPSFVVFLLLEEKLSRPLVLVLLVLVPLMLAPLAWNRLMTFSGHFYLWNDAVRLAKDKVDVSGMDRMFVNRGVELHRLKRYDLAIVDFTTALHYNPKFSPAYGGRASALAESGHVLQALPDFAEAIRLEPGFPIYRANQGKALASLGRYQEASESFQAACDIGWKIWCGAAKELREKEKK
ncbi:MAG: hypothetical protein AB7T07_08100 [Steroidobacteraceae bacterium]